MPANKRIAVWMSEKKLQKVHWQEFENACNRYGFEVFKLDLNNHLDSQEPFSVLLHKLTDIIASANQGDIKCFDIINHVEKYIAQNSHLVVVDPIPNLRRLLDRYTCYNIIHTSCLQNYGVFTPNHCVLRNNDTETIRDQLRYSKVTYPFICKPILGHGSRQAHEMLIIFNEKFLVDCPTPCVAQSFINHNAVLYKIFIVGSRHCFVRRPSLKNFQASERESIHFDSSDVSKADSKSRLCVLDPDDVIGKSDSDRELDSRNVEVIANTLRRAFGMDLLGVDVVIENSSGRYAIIDVNAYPGYDGFPNFYDALVECISEKITSQ